CGSFYDAVPNGTFFALFTMSSILPDNAFLVQENLTLSMNMQPLRTCSRCRSRRGAVLAPLGDDREFSRFSIFRTLITSLPQWPT
ncbi:MAG TPA: hypothetical protein PLF52_01170, partial [Syntrophales bacterium]|nr:hypothetical protein [Syntrophales bacterium]